MVGIPHLIAGGMDAKMNSVFFSASLVVIILAVAPWDYVWKRYVRAPGDPWLPASFGPWTRVWSQFRRLMSESRMSRGTHLVRSRREGQPLDRAGKAGRSTLVAEAEQVGLTMQEIDMYTRQELVKLGERVAEEGVHRHERELRELARAVGRCSPGAAFVLSDPTEPAVLRERALAVAADVVMRIERWPQESGHISEEATVIVPQQGQLVAQGV